MPTFLGRDSIGNAVVLRSATCLLLWIEVEWTFVCVYCRIIRVNVNQFDGHQFAFEKFALIGGQTQIQLDWRGRIEINDFVLVISLCVSVHCSSFNCAKNRRRLLFWKFNLNLRGGLYYSSGFPKKTSAAKKM